MTETVINLLEVIQIEEQHRHTGLITIRLCHSLIEAVAQQQTIGQTGQHIVMRQKLQLFFRRSMFDAGAQRFDTESKIVCKFFQQLHLIQTEGIRLRRINGERAQHMFLIFQRQGNAGAVATCKRGFAPRNHTRIGLIILINVGLHRSDRSAVGPCPYTVSAQHSRTLPR